MRESWPQISNDLAAAESEKSYRRKMCDCILAQAPFNICAIYRHIRGTKPEIDSFSSNGVHENITIMRFRRESIEVVQSIVHSHASRSFLTFFIF